MRRLIRRNKTGLNPIVMIVGMTTILICVIVGYLIIYASL